jgi:hypothetical protein
VKLHVTIADSPRTASLPYESAPFVDVAGACPSCGAESFRIIGDEPRHSVGHDYVKAPALAICCGAEVGVLRVEFNTIFGLEEDAAVLNGRVRVY